MSKPDHFEQPVILSAVRTPIGRFLGGLAPLSATELGGKVVAESVHRAGIDPQQDIVSDPARMVYSIG